MTNMQDVQSIVDHAAAQNDRWLFLALLVLTIVGTIFFWRWLTADRDKLANRLTEITDRHIKAGENFGVVVMNNSVAMTEVKDVMREVKDVMHEVKGSIAYCKMRDDQRRA